MTRLNRRPVSAAKLAFFAGAIALATIPTLAWAAREKPLPSLTPPPPTKPAAPAPDDGLGEGGFYIEANELTEDRATNKVVARGDVEARYQGRVVRAQEIDYDSNTGVVIARGGVTVVNADGTVEFSDTAVLDRQMSQGVASAFSSHLQENVTVAAASVVRRSPTVTELNQVVFTPCQLCAKHGRPTWSIRARRVVEDKKRHTILFRDAVIQVRGMPIFYVPVVWEASPETNRKSGLLIPTVNISSLRGFSWEQPYLQLISPSSDIVVSPQINSKVNPFLNIDLRKRFYTGAIDIRAGYTYEQDFNSEGDKFGSSTSHSYVLGKGLFAIDNYWLWGFTVERTSDPLIFDKYAVPDPFIDRGLYSADDRRLISQLDTVRQDQNSYISIAIMDVQGLRSTDINATFPSVAPLIEAHYEPDQPILGGRLRIEADGVILTRDESPTDLEVPGVDSRTGTIEADWQRTFILPSGIRLDPFLSAREDIFNLRNLQPPYASDANIARGIATAGLDLSWPFVKRVGDLTIVLQPLAQVVIAPIVPQDPRIPNEDSVDFQFDETNLFQVDKSPGFDILDSGQRLNLAGEVSVVSDDGRSFSALIGRSLRAETNFAVPIRSGLTGTLSDWVLAADATPLKGIDLFARWRLDSVTTTTNYLEAGANFTTSRIDGQVRYLQEADSPEGGPVKDLDFHGEVFIFKHWGITLYGAREFTSGVWRQEDIGIVYRDDCIRVEVVYRNDDTTNGVLGPSHGVGLRLTLATLGNTGYSPSPNTPSP